MEDDRARRIDEALSPAEEQRRLRALHRLEILDTPPEERFDRLIRLVARHFDMPIVLLSLVDEHRCFFKSRLGLAADNTARENTFCDRALRTAGALIVEDALEDARFVDNRLVTGPPHIRFYAAEPVRAATGEAVGFLCLIDARPRALSEEDRAAFFDFARLVEQELNATGERRAAQADIAQLHRDIDALESDLTTKAEDAKVSVRQNARLVVEREAQKRRAEASDAMSSIILNSAHEGLIGIDLTGAITFVNMAAARLTGYRPEQLIGRNMHATVHHAGADGAPYPIDDCPLTTTLRTGEGFRVENEVYWRQDGTPFPVAYTTTAVLDGHRVVGAVCSFNDITDQRLSDERLMATETALTGVLNSSRSGIFTARTVRDDEGRVADFEYVLANPAAAQMTGKPLAAIIGARMHALVPGARATGLFDRYVEVVETGEPLDLDLHYDQDGLDLWTNISAVKLDDGIAVTVSDITARKEAEAEKLRLVEQAGRHKDEFLSILSHEMRTPLNAVLGFGTILDDGIVGDLTPAQGEFMGKILQSAERMLALVDTLLDMSRVQAGQFSVERAPIALAPCVQRALAMLEPSAAARSQRLVNEVGAGLPPVLANAERVGQIVDNLVSNAIKYTPEGSTITVRVVEAPGCLRVEVADNGEGVPAWARERVFERFTQLDMSVTRARGGVGLGLSIVKALVEAHGGQVGLDSAPGRGATFWFTLPLAPAGELATRE